VGGEALVVLDGVAQVFVDGHLREALLAEFGQLGAEILQRLAGALHRGLAGAEVSSSSWWYL
jgi:hypothetical protein